MTPSLKAAMLAAVPRLRAFAISLSRNAHQADDLVQETFLRAWKSIASFDPETNLEAWLMVILRNLFYSEFRKRRRETHDFDHQDIAIAPEQVAFSEYRELRDALGKLRPHYREAIVLVYASGLSYKEASEICECPVGTLKSRVSRARAILAELMAIHSAGNFGPDPVTRAVLERGSLVDAVGFDS